MRHRANQKTWVDEKGNLVPDGHAGACILVAREGQEMNTEDISRFPNSADFFDGLVRVEIPQEPEGGDDEMEEQETQIVLKKEKKEKKKKRRLI